VIPGSWRKVPRRAVWTEANHPGCYDPMTDTIGPAHDPVRVINALAFGKGRIEAGKGGDADPEHWLEYARSVLGPPLAAARLGHLMEWAAGARWHCVDCGCVVRADEHGPYGSALRHPCTRKRIAR
jgi:hypothetical protein